MKKFINLNNLFTEHLVKTLEFNGVKDVVISPGSRNTPLVIAFDKCKRINTHVVIDERSNGFFALGLAKRTNSPTAIVTTSGTAVAEIYPAIIEAYYSRVPLIICSADRPLRLVNKGTNQTIDQRNIYKNHIRFFWDSEEIIPSLGFFKKSLKDWKNGLTVGLSENIGPIHFNFRFEKPLESFEHSHRVDEKLLNYFNNSDFKRSVLVNTKTTLSKQTINLINKSDKTLIMIGSNIIDIADCKSIYKFAEFTNAIIIADGLSNYRFGNHSKNRIIINSTAFIRNRTFIESLNPDTIIQFGNAPTSNIILNFFKLSKSNKILVNTFGDVTDPSETYDLIIKQSVKIFCEEAMKSILPKNNYSSWNKILSDLDKMAQHLKERLIHNSPFGNEARVVKELFNAIPAQSYLMVSNSIPPRDIDYFADTYRKSIKLFHNRGASGIDGIISTAAGIVANPKHQTYLIIGDTAFAHDINGLWLLDKYKIPLKIILINNSGGSIFEMLPVYKEKIDFEKYFKVPSGLNFKNIVNAFNGRHIKIKSWSHFQSSLKKQSNGFEVLEIVTNSKKSLDTRKKYWNCVVEKTQEILDDYKIR